MVLGGGVLSNIQRLLDFGVGRQHRQDYNRYNADYNRNVARFGNDAATKSAASI